MAQLNLYVQPRLVKCKTFDWSNIYKALDGISLKEDIRITLALRLWGFFSVIDRNVFEITEKNEVSSVRMSENIGKYYGEFY